MTTNIDTNQATASDTTHRFGDVISILTDPRHDRSTRLSRLQGWRGSDLEAALSAPVLAQRIGPLVCGVLAIAIAVTGSVVLLAISFATAVIGVFAPNHAAEAVFNTWARRTSRVPLPPNRAAKRLGCVVGSALLAGAATAMALGAPAIATVLTASLGSLALFVAASGICIPSIIYTLVFGAESGTRRRLLGA